MTRGERTSNRARRRIVLVANTSWYLHNFRAPTIRKLIENDWDVTAVAPDEGHRAQLEQLGARFALWPVRRSSLAPWHNGAAFARLCLLYLRLRPDVVHHFTIKPLILGGIAARLLGIRGIVQSVTGLGLAFAGSGLLRRVATAGYRFALGGNVLTIFQNEDDMHVFVSAGLVSYGRSLLIRGSGVDVDSLALIPTPPSDGTVTFLMACRMLWAKGVREFVEAAHLLSDVLPQCRFLLAGDPDTGTPDAVPHEWLESINSLPNVEWLSYQPDIRPLLARAHVVVLPSYREGAPRVLLEGGAAGRALIATDVPGCRDVAENGRAGLLVAKQDARGLADAMSALATDPVLRTTLGSEARVRVRALFSEDAVVGHTIAVYRSLLAREPEDASSMRGNGRRKEGDRSETWNGWHEELELDETRVHGDARLAGSDGPESGALVLSLDFELHWGMRDRMPADGCYRRNLVGVRDAVERILETFHEYDVGATWAVVGALFAHSSDELRECSPDIMPTYDRRNLRPYDEPVGSDHRDDPLHFAGDVIELISSAPHQEIASHTFSHYYSLEDGQTPEQFDRDLRSATLIAGRRGFRLRSIALPRNQINEAYHEILLKNGFLCYRGNHPEAVAAAHAGWRRQLDRAVRFADSLVDLRGRHTTRWEDVAEDSDLCNIPGSFFVRPCRRSWSPMARLQVRRLRDAIEHAASKKELLHLWWHPHNFGVNTKDNIRMLRSVLEAFRDCSERYGMRSLTMAEAAAEIGNQAHARRTHWEPERRSWSLGMEIQRVSF